MTAKVLKRVVARPEGLGGSGVGKVKMDQRVKRMTDPRGAPKSGSELSSQQFWRRVDKRASKRKLRKVKPSLVNNHSLNTL